MHRWETLEQLIRMPASYRRVIEELNSSNPADDNVFTDKDEDTSPEDNIDVVPPTAQSSQNSMGADGNVEGEGDDSQSAPPSTNTQAWAKDLISPEHCLLPVQASGIPLLLAPVRALTTIANTLKIQKREHVRLNFHFCEYRSPCR